MQIGVLDGIYADESADFRTSYPVNLTPVPKESGISNGYLRPADGLELFAEGPGSDRGGINWKGKCYRVMGTSFVRVDQDGSITTLGDVGGVGRVKFDYSFDRLAVSSSGNLFYWNESTLTRVDDIDLGYVVDFVWIDGYFMSTDGEFLIVTELNDPTAVDPLKYGSSEVDPDPVKALVRVQDEVYALNRHTIEVFDNVGGEGFPFQRIDGALITKGVIGTHAACELDNAVVFMGSGRDEAPSIYIAANGQAQRLATREIDQILQEYTESQLSDTIIETRIEKGHKHIWIRLPDRTLVYDVSATAVVQKPIWFVLTSGLDGFNAYPAAGLTWCYNRWIAGDPFSNRLSTLNNDRSDQFGAKVRWEFGTIVVYNEGRGGIFNQLELVCLTGRVNFSANPTVSTSYSVDGEIWSQEKFISAGKFGDRLKRLVWFQQGHMRHWRIQRFRGNSDAFISIARLEAELEPLAF